MPRRLRHNPSDEAERLYQEQFRYAANFPRALRFEAGATHAESMENLQRAAEDGHLLRFFTIDEIEHFVDYCLRAEQSVKDALRGSSLDSGSTGVEASWLRNVSIINEDAMMGDLDDVLTTVSLYSVTFHSNNDVSGPDEHFDTEEAAEQAGEDWVAEMRAFDARDQAFVCEECGFEVEQDEEGEWQHVDGLDEHPVVPVPAGDVDDGYDSEVDFGPAMFIVELSYVGGRGFTARSRSIEDPETDSVESGKPASVLFAPEEELFAPENFDLRMVYDELQADKWELGPPTGGILTLVYTRERPPWV